MHQERRMGGPCGENNIGGTPFGADVLKDVLEEAELRCCQKMLIEG
jgi:hypothetical protein